jgi:hypothetical protein
MTMWIDISGVNTPGGGRRGRVFIVNSILGVSGSGWSISDGTTAIGRELIMPVISAIRVTNSLCVSCGLPSSRNIVSSIHLAVPICLSQTPPKCEAWGGLNIHSQFCSVTYFVIAFWFIALRAWSNSDFPPMKLVPRSHRRRNDGPCKVKNRLRAQINELVSIVSNTSIWTAPWNRFIPSAWPAFKHVNISPQRFALTAPPLSFRVWILQGPNTSNPTLVNGGGVSNLSHGRSAMCCVNSFPHNLWQVMHRLILFEIIRFAPIIHIPAWRIFPYVICLPWWWTVSWKWSC